MLLSSNANAQNTSYWDSNRATSGLGNSTGTWNADAFWSTDAEGASATSNPLTTKPNTVNFGTADSITTWRTIT